MLLLSLIFTFTSLVFANNIFNNQCSLELEKIVYSPNYFYKDYLKGISKELGDLASYYDTPQGRTYVNNFSLKYQVGVFVFDAFGNFDGYTVGPIISGTTANRDNEYSSHDAQSVMNLGAYNNADTAYVYSFLSFSKDGKFYQVTIAKLDD